MSSEKRKIAYIDGKPYEIGANHTSILKFVKSYVGEKKVPTLCDDPNLAPYGACRVCSVEVALEKDGPTKMVASCLVGSEMCIRDSFEIAWRIACYNEKRLFMCFMRSYTHSYSKHPKVLWGWNEKWYG